MKTPIHAIAVAAIAGATLFSFPFSADAQVRRAVVRASRPRPAVFISGFYNPFFYRPFYASWYYRPYAFYGAYAQFPPYYGYGRGYYDLSASLRLQVEPRAAEVFIDGYYAGTVDDFDGVFQRLHLEPGDHDLELYLPGHRTVQQKVYLQPGRTFRVRLAMEPLGPGEAAPVRPAGAALPPSGRSAPSRPAPRGPVETIAGDEAAFGALSLRVQPADADVLIDGERWEGAADAERLVVQLAPGVHRVEIRKDGYRSYFTDVTIRTRETATLNVAMTRQ